MPGFPLLLAAPRLVFGNSPFAARIILALTGTAACGFVCWLGKELAGDAVGILAGAYTAISPTMVVFSVLFLSETAFAAAMVASLIAAAKLVRRESTSHSSRSIGLAILTGVLIGVATYMRPTWILVGPGLGCCLIAFGRAPFRWRLIHAGCVCAGLAVMLSPWTYRNFLVTGHAIPTTLWVGPSLYDGLNPNATGDSDMDFFEQDQLLAKMSEWAKWTVSNVDGYWTFAAENPGRVISLALVKQLRFWNPSPNSQQFQFFGAAVVAWLAFLPLVIFSVVGVWCSRHDPWLLILTVAPLFYFAALHLLFVGSLRYRLPAEYPLAVLAAFGLCRSSHLCVTTTGRRGRFRILASPNS